MEPVSAAAAVTAVAVAAIKVVLPPLIKKLSSILGGDVTPAEMKNLDDLVRYQIATLIKEASSNDLVGPSLLDNLNTAALKLEDLLSKYQYDQTKKQVSPSTLIKKLIPRTMFPKSALRKGLEELMMYIEQVGKILAPSTASTTQLLANTIPPTTSTLSTSYFARENQCNRILNFLLNESGANEVPVIAITGIEGSGKTHTAQYICDDVSVKKHFEADMWVNVRHFDVGELTREMLESASKEECPNIKNHDTLQKKLIELLSKGKRFLFVFEDVLYEDKAKWDQLVGPLNKAARSGSKIIITTRNKYIAGRLGAEIVELGKLNDRECWSIIKHYAFDDRREMNEDIGVLYKQVKRIA